MTAILYTHNEFIRPIVPECLINYFKLDINVVEITNDVDNFLTEFPLKAVPALIMADGQKFHEQVAINNLLVHESHNQAEITKLLGPADDYKLQSDILLICSFSTSDLLGQLGVYGLADMKGVPVSKESAQHAERNLDVMFKLFEERLAKHKFLVSDNITLADLTAAASFFFGFITMFGSEWRAKHPRISEWFAATIKSEYMQYRFKDFKFIDTPATISATPLPWDPNHWTDCPNIIK